MTSSESSSGSSSSSDDDDDVNSSNSKIKKKPNSNVNSSTVNNSKCNIDGETTESENEQPTEKIKNKSKKKKKKPNENTRLLRKRRSNTFIRNRINRAISQRFEIVSEEKVDKWTRKFKVRSSNTTSTGECYTVTIGEINTCTCHDFISVLSQGPCKHIMHVLHRRYSINTTSELLYQDALTQKELRGIYSNGYNRNRNNKQSTDNKQSFDHHNEATPFKKQKTANTNRIIANKIDDRKCSICKGNRKLSDWTRCGCGVLLVHTVCAKTVSAPPEECTMCSVD
eukprot:269123_1